MDPDATLQEIHSLVSQFEATRFSEEADSIASDLVEKFNALDAWLSSGGFLPRSWDLSVKRPEPVTHKEIWCDRCAKDDHNFVTNTVGTQQCVCCGKVKS